MAELAVRVPAEVELNDIPFQLVTIALDSPSESDLSVAAQASGAAGVAYEAAHLFLCYP